MAALEMLNIMETMPASLDGPLSVAELHNRIEAMKLAYADVYRYNADPRFAKVPVKGLLSKDYAKQRAALINPGKANCDVSYGAPASDTTYLSVVDREGNIVSLIQSLYDHFGSGVVVDNYGFTLQNRGGLFVLDPAHPNALAPHKRPFHTLIPAFMEKGDIHIGFGIMGGLNQAQAHAQFVSNMVDHGMNIQLALEAPRFTRKKFGVCEVQIENRIPPAVRDALTARGHQLKVMGDFSSDMGGGQAVIHNSTTRVNFGASDPRKDGAAVPEPAPYFKK
jgi:gamma-glutamyltranspeptidase/glutathione hydrolase